jgi:NAD(P)-dependent dehydrogenase (short-subunit alcohol dehydrogenase family)
VGVPRSAAITGAASGIGRALATLLRERDYPLRLVDINRAGLSAVSAELSAEVAVAADVAVASQMQDFADEVGAVDLLCLNAGVTGTVPDAPWLAPPEEWDRVFGVNVFGVVNGLRSFVPLMLERATPCHILITASLAGAATWPGGGPYSASKHAVLALAEQAALELAASNISVTVLCPALVRTAMSDQGDDPLHVAAQALEAVDEGRFAVIPEDWSAAVRHRSATLVNGVQPAIPIPARP